MDKGPDSPLRPPGLTPVALVPCRWQQGLLQHQRFSDGGCPRLPEVGLEKVHPFLGGCHPLEPEGDGDNASHDGGQAETAGDLIVKLALLLLFLQHGKDLGQEFHNRRQLHRDGHFRYRLPQGREIYRLLARSLGYALAFDPQLVIISQEVYGLGVGILQKQPGAQGPTPGRGRIDFEALKAHLGGLNLPLGQLPDSAGRHGREEYQRQEDTGP
jgi:hypothetical protein